MNNESSQVGRRNESGRPQGYWRGMSYTLASGALWGSTYPAIALALNYLNAFEISFYRAFFATITLTIVFLFQGRLKEMLPKRAHLTPVVMASFFGATGFWTFLNLSVLYLRADISSFVVALYPLLAVVLATIVLKERMTKFRATGVILGVVGIYLIAIYGRGAQLSGSFPLVGVLIGLLAALSWAGYMVTSRYLTSQISNSNVFLVTPEYVTFNTFLIATPATLVLAYLKGSGLPSIVSFTQGASSLLYLGVLTSAFAFLIFNTGMRLIGVNGAAINQLLFPLVAVIISYFVLGEILNGSEALGMILIASGIIVAQIKLRN